MSRYKDKGPYEMGNVEIVPMQQNQSEAMRGKKKSPMPEEQKQLIASRLRGKKCSPRSPEHTKKQAAARKGKVWTVEQRQRASDNWHKKRGLTS
jgi:hypothetical protein